MKAGLGMRDLKAWTILETIGKNNNPGVNNLVCAPLLFSPISFWRVQVQLSFSYPVVVIRDSC